MSSSSNRIQLRLMDWLRPQLRWVSGPSWILSALLHVGLASALLFLSQMPSCQRDISGDQGESFREVGIHMRPAQPTESREESETDSLEQVLEKRVNPLDAPEFSAADQPPVPLDLPQFETPSPVIGSGQMPSLDGPALPELITPTTATPQFGGGNPPPTPGGTSFLGIQDTGKKFVYVIDYSFSMETGNALQAAKMELLASLSQLDETQQFQVVFYNHEYVTLKTRGGRFDMFWGTDAQRLQVSEQLRMIKPTGGTRHFPALLHALRFDPDVVFLLTDGDAHSALTREEFEQVRRNNRGGARIHCIEFGIGAQPALERAGNFLKKLADEHQGQYTYRNIRKR